MILKNDFSSQLSEIWNSLMKNLTVFTRFWVNLNMELYYSSMIWRKNQGIVTESLVSVKDSTIEVLKAGNSELKSKIDSLEEKSLN